MMLRAMCALALGLAPQEEPPRTHSVRGKVTLSVKGVSLDKLGPTVVYLDARQGKLDFKPPADPARISQRKAQFSPSFLVVCAGQTLEMPNDDTITHNVFSYSPPNAFDLGLYAKGESRSVALRHPGVVRIYCSIHKTMKGTIFVAPSPYFARTDAAGAFEIRGVPPGRYALKTWNEMLPQVSREVEVRGEGDGPLEIRIGETK